MKKYLLLIIAYCTYLNTSAQLLPTNQLEQNACDALVLCGNTFTSPYSYQGYGTVMDLATTPCSGGEANSMWIRLNVNTAGSIVFTLTPLVATDDYDFAIVNITGKTCSTFTAADVIRCNYNNNSPGSNVNGAIGLNNTSLLNFVAGGTFGSSFLQQINANAGDVYLIMINNFGYYTGGGGPSSGFTIDFTGSTATFNTPPPPQMVQIDPECDMSSKITIQLDQNVKCSSIAADGSDFKLTPSGIIASAASINCTGGSGYTNSIELTFASPLPNGFYEVHAQIGSDGNSVLNLCDVGIDLPSKLKFEVGINPILLVSVDTPTCQYITMRFSAPFDCSSIAADGSDFEVVGPSNVTVASVVGQNCAAGLLTDVVTVRLSAPIVVDGDYTIKVKQGSDNNTLKDECGRAVPIGTSHNFKINSYNGKLKALPDGLACYFGEQISLNGSINAKAPAGGFKYNWTASSGNTVTNPNSMSSAATVNNIFNYFILETIDTFGCVLRDSANIRVQIFKGSVYPTSILLCEDEGAILTAGGGVDYRWTAPIYTGQNPGIENDKNYKTFIYPELGEHVYKIVITNDRNCVDEIEIPVVVKAKPEITVLPKDTTIKIGDAIDLKAFGGLDYSWEPNVNINTPEGPTVLVRPTKDIKYIVVGRNEYGCPNTDTANITIDFTSQTFMPNAFSPNGDGLNDIFKIQNVRFERLILFNIYNRFGNLIFSTQDVNKGWDGTIDGKPAPSDVYFYMIQLGFGNSNTQTIKGDVTLIR